MMEILAHGNEERFHATCTTCRCIFSFNERDAVHINNLKLVKCPECGHKLLFSEDDEQYSHPVLDLPRRD